LALGSDGKTIFGPKGEKIWTTPIWAIESLRREDNKNKEDRKSSPSLSQIQGLSVLVSDKITLLTLRLLNTSES
jgi:hypothetical protein